MVNKKLTYETVYDEIKRNIKEGHWKQGEQLPPLEQLSAELGVGISSVREAVRILGKQKILRIEQGRGTYVESELTETPEHRLDFLEAGDHAAANGSAIDHRAGACRDGRRQSDPGGSRSYYGDG